MSETNDTQTTVTAQDPAVQSNSTVTVEPVAPNALDANAMTLLIQKRLDAEPEPESKATMDVAGTDQIQTQEGDKKDAGAADTKQGVENSESWIDNLEKVVKPEEGKKNGADEQVQGDEGGKLLVKGIDGSIVEVTPDLVHHLVEYYAPAENWNALNQAWVENPQNVLEALVAHLNTEHKTDFALMPNVTPVLAFDETMEKNYWEMREAQIIKDVTQEMYGEEYEADPADRLAIHAIRKEAREALQKEKSAFEAKKTQAIEQATKDAQSSNDRKPDAKKLKEEMEAQQAETAQRQADAIRAGLSKVNKFADEIKFPKDDSLRLALYGATAAMERFKGMTQESAMKAAMQSIGKLVSDQVQSELAKRNGKRPAGISQRNFVTSGGADTQKAKDIFDPDFVAKHILDKLQ